MSAQQSGRRRVTSSSTGYDSGTHTRDQPRKDVPNGVTIQVTTNEMMWPVWIYRSDGFTTDLYPVTNILPLNGNTVAYTDTSQYCR